MTIVGGLEIRGIGKFNGTSTMRRVGSPHPESCKVGSRMGFRRRSKLGFAFILKSHLLR